MRLTQKRTKLELVRIPGWRRVGKQISATFTFDNFAQSMRFVNKVARRAESMNHHPDISIQYSKVRLRLTTHDEGGLTIKDFKLAGKINRLGRS